MVVWFSGWGRGSGCQGTFWDVRETKPDILRVHRADDKSPLLVLKPHRDDLGM